MVSLDDYLALPVVAADQRIAYGHDPEQFGDLYLPAGDGAHPVVVVIHGGCWQAMYNLAPLGTLCDALRNEGMAVWNLEYRRLGNGGGWPGTFEDIARGMDILRSETDRSRLDLSRVVVVGHSAGGHLALWAGARHRLPGHSPLFTPHPLPVAGIVALAGIPDLAAAVQWTICGDAPTQLAGGAPTDLPERYRQISPAELLPLGIPQQHLVGNHDAIVPVGYLEAYVSQASRLDDVALQVCAGAGHFEPVFPTSMVWPVLKQTILALLGIGDGPG